MYTVKYLKYSLLVLLISFYSCSGILNESTSIQSVDNSCDKVRAALDIGSGSTKLLVANINTCTNTINNLIFEAQRPIDFKEDLQHSKNNKFSKEIIQKSISTFNELEHLAYSQGAVDIRAVATSAFRSAANSKEAASKIEEYTKFKINIISQESEALFAYHAALNEINSKKLIDNSKPLAIWDIGGGSMQIVKRESMQREDKVVFLGQNASVSYKNKLLKHIGKTSKNSPNPLGKKSAIEAMNLARKYATLDARALLGNLSDYQVFGVGGVHYHSLRSQTNRPEAYDQALLLETLLKRANLNDKQVGGDYAKTDVTNIALVLGYMQALKIDKVTPLKINMTHGILLDKTLWETSPE